MKTGLDCKKALEAGINKVANVVKSTAGAKGKLSLIESYNGLTPHSTKDGVTVIKELDLQDPYERLGLHLVREAALKTVGSTGDGTTTTTILAQALINNLFKSNENHVDLIKGVQEAVKDVNTQLDKLKKQVTEDNFSNIATISANGDREVGDKISDIYKKVGLDATIKVTEGNSENISVVYNEGLKFDNGWYVPHFSTNYGKGITEFKEAYLSIFGGKIKSIEDVRHSVEYAKQNNKPLVIFTDEIEDNILASLIELHTKGHMQVCVCLSPEHGNYREKILDDISYITGADIYDGTPKTGFIPGEITNFMATRDKTVFNVLEQELVDERVALLKEQLGVETNDVDAERLRKRIANLKASVVEVIVGGVTDIARKEKKDRVEDAIPALRVAIEDGFVAGGGTAFRYIANKLTNEKNSEGYNIVLESIKKKKKVILKNGGIVSISNEGLSYGHGIDVLDGKTKNFIKTGIIDPVRVEKVALENAISVALTALQTDSLILTKFQM